MEGMKFVSLNARGLRDRGKQCKIWRFMKFHKADVAMIQEAHVCEKDAFIWSNEWGNKCIFAYGDSNTRGVGILLSKRIAGKIQEIVCDIHGHYLLAKVILNEYTYTICNIYAPNEDSPDYFNEIFEKIKNLDSIFTVIGGDFNVALNPLLDHSNPVWHNVNTWNCIKDWIESENWCDIWRFQHQEEKRFTWVKTRPNICWSRIDYWLVSANLVNSTIGTDILPCVHSDHSAIELSIATVEEERGPGYWKFNDTLLNDEDFITEVHNLTSGIVRAYDYICPMDLWEMIKCELIALCKDYAKRTNYNENCERFDLYRILGAMQDKLVKSEGIVSHSFVDNMNRVKCEINSFETQDAKQAAFRCRVNYSYMGELPTRYFFNMEKRNFTNKTMYMARKEDGTITKDYAEILNLQSEFYRQLYSKDHRVNFDMVNRSGISLNAGARLSMEEKISMDELYDAMMTLKSGKAPGWDGLSLLFYRKFWNVLKKPLFDCLSTAVDKGYLNLTARRGIINLIPKKKDLLLVKNWRGITLLAYDYKIYAKAIANRLGVLTPDLVGMQQSGFIRG